MNNKNILKAWDLFIGALIIAFALIVPYDWVFRINSGTN